MCLWLAVARGLPVKHKHRCHNGADGDIAAEGDDDNDTGDDDGANNERKYLFFNMPRHPVGIIPFALLSLSPILLSSLEKLPIIWQVHP